MTFDLYEYLQAFDRLARENGFSRDLVAKVLLRKYDTEVTCSKWRSRLHAHNSAATRGLSDFLCKRG